jgi:fatty acid desaturase
MRKLGLIGSANSVYPEKPAKDSTPNHYPELRRLIKERGLLDKQPAYYASKILLTLVMLILSIILLVIVDNFWLQLVNAAFLAFVFGQIGYVGHDAGHRAVCRSIRGNTIIGLSVSFLIGLSRTWWVTQHNQHHSTPNDLDLDPHTALPLLAFSEDAARSKRGLMRFVVGYQAFYFVPLLLLEGIGMRLASIQFLLRRRKEKYMVTEPLLMGLHFVLYFGLLFYLLSPWQVLVFTLVHQGLFGLYYGLVFAPNHKGMLIIDESNSLNFLLTQVLTTRNVKPNPFVDFWYGGLNYQIEHHLFPMMPRNKLGAAREIVKAFCQQRDISYEETGTLKSYLEILSFMHRVSAPLRWGPGSAKQMARGYQLEDS